MRVDLQEKLIKKYPSLFIQVNHPMTNTCMCWGIECGDGWYDLIDRTCAKIMAVDPDKNKNVSFCQIKEKFGGLRLYLDNADNAAFEICCSAEQESYTICELCGKAGKHNNDSSWISTLCNKCRMTKNNE